MWNSTYINDIVRESKFNYEHAVERVMHLRELLFLSQSYIYDNREIASQYDIIFPVNVKRVG